MIDRSRTRAPLSTIVDFIRGRVSGETTAFRSQAFGNSLFVGVSLGGMVYVSDDDETWMPMFPGTYGIESGDLFSGVVYDGSKFILVGYRGVVYLGNGTSWTKQTTTGLEDTDLHCICLGHPNSLPLYLASASRGIIYSSSNATTWTRTSAGVSLDSIAWGLGKFVGVNYGEIWSSTNGFAWSKASDGETADLRGIIFSGSRFVVVGGNGGIFSSSTLSSWERIVGSFSNDIFSICHDGTNFHLSISDGCSAISQTFGAWEISTRKYLLSDLSLRSWSFAVIPCESDLEFLFRIHKTIQPPGLVIIADETKSSKSMRNGMDAASWAWRESKISMILFAKKLSTPNANILAISAMEEQALALFDYQLLGNFLFRYIGSKGISLERWSNIVACKFEVSVEDGQVR